MELDRIFPTQIERARKIAKRYYFDGFQIISLEYATKRLEPIIDYIEDFEPHSYRLLEVEEYYQRDGSRAYRGYLEVTYLSIERELFNLRY